MRFISSKIPPLSAVLREQGIIGLSFVQFESIGDCNVQVSKASAHGCAFTVVAIGASAQDGGVIIGTNFGGDPTSVNPLLTNNTVDLSLTEFLFPSLYNIDPETRSPMKGGRNDQDNGLGAGLVHLRRWLGLHIHLA